MQPRRPPTFAWDPSAPSKLTIPKAAASSPAFAATPQSGDASNGGFQIDHFHAHDGVGCNEHETTALIEILEAQQDHCSPRTAPLQPPGSLKSLKQLSKQYCISLFLCLQAWEQSQLQDAAKRPSPNDRNNAELLKLSFAVIHLSQTFILRPEVTEQFVDYDDLSEAQGAATADTVRYLRLHHLADALADAASPEDVQQVLQSMHPDQVGSNGAVYWTIIEKLALRGCLDEVWALLSQHSLCKQCYNEDIEALDDMHTRSLAIDRENFHTLRQILLSAPLPGGRDETRDVGVKLPSSNGELDDDDDDDEDDGEHGDLHNGIPRSAYKLWETDAEIREASGFPQQFNELTADDTYKTWKNLIVACNASLTQLCRRIPQLTKLIKILVGDFHNVTFQSWAEALLAELLYVRPTMRPKDIHVRAHLAMQQMGDDPNGVTQSLVLSIMKGNANRVIEVLYQSGGASGAALPATMTALVHQLFAEANIINLPTHHSSFGTELLGHAANAVLSSFAHEDRPDLGMRLATQLLTPHISPDSDPKLSSILGQLLERYAPSSDADAQAVLSLCSRLTARKNIPLVDGCARIVLSRYRFYQSDDRPGGAAYWLMKGVELESTLLTRTVNEPWQQKEATRSCYAILTEQCFQLSQQFLKALLGDGAGIAVLFEKAKEIVQSLSEFELAPSIEAFTVLGHLVAMGEALTEGSDPTKCASSIIACLEETPRKEDDEAVATLAPRPLHCDLLRLAVKIIEQDMIRSSIIIAGDDNVVVSSFDVRGVQVLLERYAIHMARSDMHKPSTSENKEEDEMEAMREPLANALSRAFVAENAKKKPHLVEGGVSDPVSVAIPTKDLHKFSKTRQERSVAAMLDF